VNLQLLIWDLEGHTKFKGITPSYLQGASGAVVVADVSRIETVERLLEHVQLFSSINPKATIVVALNKSDLVDEEKLAKFTQLVPVHDCERLVKIYQTSAKTGVYVDEMFQKLAEKSLESL
jgi:GTPase SAR1 family protein